MSGFTFSNQFNQRWLDTPATVRQAISEELADIIRLLQPETQPDDFAFSAPDLDAHIAKLYAKHQADKQQKEEQAQAKQAATQTANKDAAKHPVADASASVSTSANTPDSHAENMPQTVSAMPADKARSVNTEDEANGDGNIDNDASNTDNTADTVNDHAELSPAHRELIADLESRIDDYLSDTLATMSEDLKAWLRHEVRQQLNDLSK